ncbi:MAG: sugar transferase [Bacteroidales bacterium]
MKKTLLAFVYLLFDLAGSVAAWIIFCSTAGIPAVLELNATGEVTAFYIKSSLIVSLCWAAVFFITGFYSVSLKRSRLQELFYSLVVTIPGTVFLFIILLIKKYLTDNSLFLHSLISLFTFQFLLTYIPRTLITSATARRIHRGKVGYKTLILGSNSKAIEIYRRIKEEKIPGGNIFTGYIRINGNGNHQPEWDLKCLGGPEDILNVINNYQIEEVIIAIEDDEFEKMLKIIGELQFTDVTIKAIPSLKDLLTGKIEHTSIFGTPLLEIPNRTITVTQAIIKQIMDYVVAVPLLIILLPVILILSLAIKLHDNGPVIFRQERIGRNGRPFIILKFRSMHKDAEKAGPALSGRDDPRITPVGRFMRKHRLDEIPNLINVLKGEMSLVGPRPERQYYIEQIVKKVPHFRRLLKVKPGITSWGQVKFGYASTIDQMIERLEYDLIYIDNMNLIVDLKIIIYTISIIIKGKGL